MHCLYKAANKYAMKPGHTLVVQCMSVLHLLQFGCTTTATSHGGWGGGRIWFSSLAGLIQQLHGHWTSSGRSEDTRLGAAGCSLTATGMVWSITWIYYTIKWQGNCFYLAKSSWNNKGSKFYVKKAEAGNTYSEEQTLHWVGPSWDAPT